MVHLFLLVAALSRESAAQRAAPTPASRYIQARAQATVTGIVAARLTTVLPRGPVRSSVISVFLAAEAPQAQTLADKKALLQAMVAFEGGEASELDWEERERFRAQARSLWAQTRSLAVLEAAKAWEQGRDEVGSAKTGRFKAVAP